MPWQETTVMSSRREFVILATVPGANVAQLSQRFGISRKTAYKWLERYREAGEDGLADQSRRPHGSPRRTSPEVEQAVLAVREAHPAWGGRKIRARLLADGSGHAPTASTITAILARHERLDPEESSKHRAWKRFESEAPNQLWQIDFKGHFPLTEGGRCHPLTVLDDHSRYALGVRACSDERRKTVQEELSAIFRRYGMPERLLVDNGPPWGAGGYERYTRLEVWLMRLGIAIRHAARQHPQTIGKDERFHRTLEAEVIRPCAFRDVQEAQAHFDPWREMYNHIRPHEALAMPVPASRYQESPRLFPETLPAVEYDLGEIVRSVDERGRMVYGGQWFRVGKGLIGNRVALRPSTEDGVIDVYFCRQRISQLDIRSRHTRA